MSGKQYQSGNLPKNIRQIGTNTGNSRIYMEDYVYTYLHSKEDPEEWLHRGFVLLGRLEREQNYSRFFISGMIRMTDEYFQDDIVAFNDKAWAYIYQEMKKYYDDLEIVGWGQDISGGSSGFSAELLRHHKQNFNVQKNVLLMLDMVEPDEDCFYVFEKNSLQRRDGYYIYYEKNPQMQEYMIQKRKEDQPDSNPGKEEEEPDAAIDYREILQMRKNQMSSKKWTGVLYSTSMLLVLSVCVLGVTMMNNSRKMQYLENTVEEISDTADNSDELPVISQNAKEETVTEDSGPVDPKQSEEADPEMAVDTAANELESENDLAQKDSKKSGKDEKEERISSDSLPETNDDQKQTQLTEAQTWLLQGYYIVKKGDSLVGISQRIYGTSQKVDRICELNDIEDVDKIYEGQKLYLP